MILFHSCQLSYCRQQPKIIVHRHCAVCVDCLSLALYRLPLSDTKDFSLKAPGSHLSKDSQIVWSKIKVVRVGDESSKRPITPTVWVSIVSTGHTFWRINFIKRKYYHSLIKYKSTNTSNQSQIIKAKVNSKQSTQHKLTLNSQHKYKIKHEAFLSIFRINSP